MLRSEKYLVDELVNDAFTFISCHLLFSGPSAKYNADRRRVLLDSSYLETSSNC